MLYFSKLPTILNFFNLLQEISYKLQMEVHIDISILSINSGDQKCKLSTDLINTSSPLNQNQLLSLKLFQEKHKFCFIWIMLLSRLSCSSNQDQKLQKLGQDQGLFPVRQQKLFNKVDIFIHFSLINKELKSQRNSLKI